MQIEYKINSKKITYWILRKKKNIKTKPRSLFRYILLWIYNYLSLIVHIIEVYNMPLIQFHFQFDDMKFREINRERNTERENVFTRWKEIHSFDKNTVWLSTRM